MWQSYHSLEHTQSLDGHETHLCDNHKVKLKAETQLSSEVNFDSRGALGEMLQLLAAVELLGKRWLVGMVDMNEADKQINVV